MLLVLPVLVLMLLGSPVLLFAVQTASFAPPDRS